MEIEISDLADEILNELCLNLGLGRGELMGLALELMGEAVTESNDLAYSLNKRAGQIRDSRSVINIAKVRLELEEIKRKIEHP